MSNLKFYFTPGACSIAAHILMEELELVFEAYLIDILNGDQYKPEYMAINPKGTIPTLILKDGTALTDLVAIVWWLAEKHPRKKLLPVKSEEQVKLMELLNYITQTIHGQGYTRIFTTERYASTGADEATIKAEGKAIVERGLAKVAEQLEGGCFAFGEFTILDAILFYVEFWGDRIELPLPNECRLHYQRLLQRPAVRQVLMEEGYHGTLTAPRNQSNERSEQKTLH